MTVGRRWLVVLLAVALIPTAWLLVRWRAIAGDQLSEAARHEVLRLSDSVYVLNVSPIRFRFFLGGLAFDSLHVTTDSARRMAHPTAAALRLSAYGCQVSGVDNWRLISGQGLQGQLFQCDSVRVDASRDVSAAPRPGKGRHSLPQRFLTFEQAFHLPQAVPLVAIEDVDFPDIRLDLHHAEADAPAYAAILHRFSAHLGGLLLDPGAPVAERRPLFSQEIRLGATGFSVTTADQVVRMRQLTADVARSTLTVVGLQLEPTGTARDWLARQQFRRPWVQVTLDSLEFTGVDMPMLLTSGSVSAERVVIDGLDAAVETDASLPPRKEPRAPATSPLEEAVGTVSLGASVAVAQLALAHGSARYVGHRRGHSAAIIDLPHLAFEADSVLFDPGIGRGHRQSRLAGAARLTLDGASYGTADSLRRLTIDELHLDVGDSLLVARGISTGPALGDSAWMARQRVRRFLSRTSMDSVVLKGVDFRRLTSSGAAHIRELAIGGMRASILDDLRLPAAPAPPRRTHTTLDSTLTDFGIPTSIGRLHLEGAVDYVARRAGAPDDAYRVGRLTLDGVALAVGSRESPEAPILSQRLTLRLGGITQRTGQSASLMVGELTASLFDSTLVVDRIRLAPATASGARRTTLRASLDSMRLTGVDFVDLEDGRGAVIGQAVIGHGAFEVAVDARVAADPRKGRGAPVRIRDLRLVRAEGKYTERRAEGEPLTISAGRLTASAHDVGVGGEAARPILTQDVRIDGTGLVFSSGKLAGSVADARIDLGDSSVALRGLRVQAGTRRTDISVDTLALNGLDLDGLVRDTDPAGAVAPHQGRLERLGRRGAVAAAGIAIGEGVTVGALDAVLLDSTVRVRDIRIGSSETDSAWVARQAHRRSRVTVRTDSLTVAGLAASRLLADEGIWLRSGRLFGLGIDVYSDKRLPPNPVAVRHSTVQEDMRSIALPFGVDTLLVVGGQVVYREQDLDHPEPGVVPFTGVAARITGFTSRATSGGPPLEVQVQSTLFEAAQLDISATAPLTAPGYDLRYHGRLGPMPATAANMIIATALPVRAEAGQIDSVTFDVVSTDGRAVGSIVPTYRGLEIKLTDRSGSLLKKAEVSVLNFGAREFLVRHDNPHKASEPPRSGAIDHTFAGETVVDFLWYALRGGLEKVMEK